MARKSTSSSRPSSGDNPVRRIRWLDFPVLSAGFYARDTVLVARELLGKVLVVRSKKGIQVGRIVETEAYTESDPAAHTFRGRTPRSAPMFEGPGHAYVYFIYGMHEMLNFVTEPEGKAGAVLIRALELLDGEANSAHANGPGKLTRILGIARRHNRDPLQGPRLWVVDDGYRVSALSSSPRVGISEARELPWRYFITGHPCVSRAPQNQAACALGEAYFTQWKQPSLSSPKR